MLETRTETTETRTIGGVKKTTERVYEYTDHWSLKEVVTHYELGDASAVVHDFCVTGYRAGNDAATMVTSHKYMPPQRMRCYKHAESAHEKAIDWCIEHR